MIMHVIIPSLIFAIQTFLNVIFLQQIAKLENEIDRLNQEKLNK